jgi:large subunit ribosomal protein L12
MEYVYSALLLHSANQEISGANIKKVLVSAGVQPDEAKIKALVASMEGVNIEDAVQQAAVAVAAPAAAGEEKKEEASEEEEEKKAEEAAAGLGALFG